jgi:hypothetical protein
MASVGEFIGGNYQFLDIPVAAGTYQQINIPDQAQLRGAPILAIEAYNVNDFPNSFANNFNALPTQAQFAKASLVLYNSQNDGKSFANGVLNIPLVRMHNIRNAVPDPYIDYLVQFNGFIVQWQKSSIQFSSAVTFASAVSFCFGIWYPNNTFGNQ